MRAGTSPSSAAGLVYIAVLFALPLISLLVFLCAKVTEDMSTGSGCFYWAVVMTLGVPACIALVAWVMWATA